MRCKAKDFSLSLSVAGQFASPLGRGLQLQPCRKSRSSRLFSRGLWVSRPKFGSAMRRENNAIINRRFYGQTAMIGYYKKHVFALADRLSRFYLERTRHQAGETSRKQARIQA